MQPVEIIFSSNYTAIDVAVSVHPDDIALEVIEEINLRLVPLPPWNETAGLVILNTNNKLLIVDNDSMLSTRRIYSVEVLEPS